ncbi:MAG: hypothetical protein M1812_002236 [Candelaria pacifica]|nr:MAG: hypothetical protein M1812_002236 [Candelaria pacifica]
MEGYGQNKYPIPKWYSSLVHTVGSEEKQQIFLEIENRKIELSKKASDLAIRNEQYGGLHRAASEEWVETKRELLRMSKASYATLMDLYREGYHKGEIGQPACDHLMEGCTYKKAQDRVNFEEAYVSLFTEIFHGEEKNPEYESRKTFSLQTEEGKYYTETTWTDGLCEYYNAADPEDPTFLWCPITKTYTEGSHDRRCAHIVPQSLNSRTIGFLFGEPEEGVAIRWSMKNAMIIANKLETAFDKGWFILLPLESKPNEPSRWQFYLMDQDKANVRWGTRKTDGTFGQLHKTELEFKNNNRPGHRNLYFHFVCTLLRYKAFEKPGWDDFGKTYQQALYGPLPAPICVAVCLRFLHRLLAINMNSRQTRTGEVYLEETKSCRQTKRRA